MKKALLLTLPILVVAAVAAAFFMMRPEPEWTTDSSRALRAYESCLGAARKLYFAEARAECQAAVDADPGFVAARLRLVMLPGGEKDEEERLLEELAEADTSELTPRESLMVRYWLARKGLTKEGQEGSPEAIVASYLTQDPEDPWALSILCNVAWERQDWANAAACYRKLLEIDPNWVTAQNHLGYIAMAQGRFDEAEDHFRTYGFVAPDQANPHDSMGELYTLTGRYEEAAEEFRRALEIRSDFCSSHRNLVRLNLVWRRYPEARAALADMEASGACGDYQEEFLAYRCSVELWSRVAETDWEGAWQEMQGPCSAAPGDVQVVGHAAAAQTGHLEEARAIEKSFKVRAGTAEGVYQEILEALLLNMKGTRLAVEGDLEGAIDNYRAADGRLRYWHDAGLGIFKLHNERLLALALQQVGRSEEADEVVERIRAVNPRFLEAWGDSSGT